MPLVGFEPTIPARERPQTHALHGEATGIGAGWIYDTKYDFKFSSRFSLLCSSNFLSVRQVY
jgi:hypothetical protein